MHFSQRNAVNNDRYLKQRLTYFLKNRYDQMTQEHVLIWFYSTSSPRCC